MALSLRGWWLSRLPGSDFPGSLGDQTRKEKTEAFLAESKPPMGCPRKSRWQGIFSGGSKGPCKRERKFQNNLWRFYWHRGKRINRRSYSAYPTDITAPSQACDKRITPRKSGDWKPDITGTFPFTKVWFLFYAKYQRSVLSPPHPYNWPDT